MIASNIAPISHSLQMLVQKLREETRLKAEFGGGSRDVNRADQSVIQATEQVLNKTDQILANLQREEELIQRDELLSDTGKVQKMVKLVEQIYASLQFVRETATTTRKAAESAKAAFTNVPATKLDPAVDALLCIEVRAALRKLSQADRMKLVTESVQQKNDLILRAVMTDPFFSSAISEPMLPHSYLDRLMDESAKTTKTQDYRRSESLAFSAERLELLAGGITGVLSGYGQEPKFPTPPVRKSDLGQTNQQTSPDKSQADKPAGDAMALK